MHPSRRSFLRAAALTGVGASLLPNEVFSWAGNQPVHLAYLGHSTAAVIPSPVPWKAIQVFTSIDDAAFQQLLQRDDIDAVVVDVAPAQRTAIALAAMKAGKCTIFTEPVGQTAVSIQSLMATHRQTGTPCLLLDNDRFHRDVLAVSNMVRQGQFGDLTHVTCGTDSSTNGLGPAMEWLGINRVNRFVSLSASISRSWGIHELAPAIRTKENESISRQYELGEVLTIQVRCVNGQTVTINRDLAGKRPYERGYRVQGVNGYWMEDNDVLSLNGQSKPFSAIQSRFDHPYWQSNGRATQSEPNTLSSLVDTLKTQTIAPVDTQNALTISLVYAVAKASLGAWGEEVEIPDWFA